MDEGNPHARPGPSRVARRRILVLARLGAEFETVRRSTVRPERAPRPGDRLTADIPHNAPGHTLASRLGLRLHREDLTPAGVPVVVYELLSGRTSRPIARWASGA